MSGSLLRWFESYLSGRTQMVKLGRYLSSEICVKRGMPLGSLLGPLLFLIYINDMFSLPTVGTLFAFADDSALIVSASDDDLLTRKVQSDLDLLNDWFSLNKLTLNALKTNTVHYKFKQDNSTLGDLFIHEEHRNGLCTCLPSLEKSATTKYLGVILDATLTYGLHIAFLQAKLRKINYVLFHLKNSLVKNIH